MRDYRSRQRHTSFLYRAMTMLSLHDLPPGGEGGTGGSGGAGGGGGTETPEQLTARIAAVDAKNRELLADQRRLKDSLKLFEGLDPDKARQAIEFHSKSEEEKARAAGNFDQMKKQLVDNHGIELGKVTTRAQKLEAQLYTVMAGSQITGALTGPDGQPLGSAELLMPVLSPLVKVVEKGDTFETQVVDANGNQRFKDGAGTAMTVADLVAEFQANPKYAPAFFAPNVSGSGSGGSSAGAGALTGRTLRLSKADQKDPQKYRSAKDRAAKDGLTLVLE